MTDLSIAARAVLDASNLLPGKDSCLILAAALRAAADQVVPRSISPEKTRAGCVKLSIRNRLQSLAAELEAQ